MGALLRRFGLRLRLAGLHLRLAYLEYPEFDEPSLRAITAVEKEIEAVRKQIAEGRDRDEAGE